jgi:predicted RNase H-like HicB family nuclease
MKPNNSKKEKWLKSVSFEQYIRLALSHAEFSQNEDGSWTVEIPVLLGCVTWGATRGEAVEMAKDAAEAWVLTALRFGDEVPPIDGNSLQYAVDRLGAKV